MTRVAAAFDQAVRHHQAGDFAQAEQFYQQVLAGDPGHVDALYLLGLLAQQLGRYDQAIDCLSTALRFQLDHVKARTTLGEILRQQGRLEEAVACFERALDLQPDNAHLHNNLGIALAVQGKLDAALASWRQALRLQPDNPDVYNNLAGVFAAQGKREEAVASLQQALRLQPGHAKACNNLGKLLRDQGKLEDAVAHFQQALYLQPDFAEAHYNLGSALRKQGKLAEAVACLHQALTFRPDNAEAHNNLGIALQEQGQLTEALASFQQALALQPNYAEAHNNLGILLRDQGAGEEAATCFRRALRCKPGLAEAHNNLGTVLLDMRELSEAETCFQHAVQLQPDYAEAHGNLGMTWLLQGRFDQSWPEYEWRGRIKEWAFPSFAQPRWRGEPLHGQTILITTEQGFGDTLQFIRYAPLVQERGGRVLVRCRPELLRLLATCPGIAGLIPEGQSLPAFAVHAPLLSLPGVFKTTLATIPAQVPYLDAEPNLVNRWRQELGGDGFKVGIVWQGSLSQKRDLRPVPLTRFAPLAAVPGVRLYSLQRGSGAEQLAGAGFPVTDLGSRVEDFADTAAILKNLNLVVTMDTAVAHCAGALGVPVWLALQFVPDWRWLLEREDNPWYPTMRLFRQHQPGQWEDVFARIGRELHELTRAWPR